MNSRLIRAVERIPHRNFRFELFTAKKKENEIHRKDAKNAEGDYSFNFEAPGRPDNINNSES